jgi:hypothetical protein
MSQGLALSAVRSRSRGEGVRASRCRQDGIRCGRTQVSLSVVDDNRRVAESQLDPVRRIALALPGVTERHMHGAVGFFVQGRRPLCYVHDNHRGDGRVSLWLPSSASVQEELISAEPRRFFRPTPSASGTSSSWLGVFLDLSGDDVVDWQEIAAAVLEAYRGIAPRRLIADLGPKE